MKRLGAIGRRVRAGLRLTGLSAWRGFLGFYNSDDLTHAASISYYALLSLFPFFLLALAILGGATADDTERRAVMVFVLRYFPAQFEFITRQLDSFRADRLTIGVMGTIALVWGALGVFGAVSTAVNHAWGVEKQRSFWKHKLFSFLMLTVAGTMFIVALLLISATRVVSASWFAGVLANFPGLVVLRSLTIRNATTLLFIARRRIRLLLRAEREGAVSRRVDWRAGDGAAVEGDARGLCVVRTGHVPVHAHQRLDCGRRGVPDVGLRPGGHSAVRRGVHRGLCAAAARQAG